jgi:hypothetical protein
MRKTELVARGFVLQKNAKRNSSNQREMPPDGNSDLQQILKNLTKCKYVGKPYI